MIFFVFFGIDIEAMFKLLLRNSLHILGIISFLKEMIVLYFQVLDYCVVTKINLMKNLNNMDNTYTVIICKKKSGYKFGYITRSQLY